MRCWCGSRGLRYRSRPANTDHGRDGHVLRSAAGQRRRGDQSRRPFRRADGELSADRCRAGVATRVHLRHRSFRCIATAMPGVPSWRCAVVRRPIAGLARAGIDSTALVEGRTATVTGIVKRACIQLRPTNDFRWPSKASPLTSGWARRARRRPAPMTRRQPQGPTDRPRRRTRCTARHHQMPRLASQLPSAMSAGNKGPSWSSAAVLTKEINGSKLTVDDSSGMAIIELAGAAASRAAEFRVGDLINVTGLAARDESGQLLVVVSEPADVSRLSGAGDAATGQSSAAAGERSQAPGLASGPGSGRGSTLFGGYRAGRLVTHRTVAGTAGGGRPGLAPASSPFGRTGLAKGVRPEIRLIRRLRPFDATLRVALTCAPRSRLS